LPPALAVMLERVLAEEDRADGARAALLRRHYLELMPALRAEQLAPDREPQATFMHARLELRALPRLAGALDRLASLLARCGVPPERALPASSPGELLARFPTLAELYPTTSYGGVMPMLYAYPAELAAFARELEGATLHEVIDRRLTGPLVHELSHLGRSRSGPLPPYLDECIAAHLGVLVLPELAYPAPGEDNGLYATPWLSQVGQALARAVGLEPLLRAHAGVVPWDGVLPEGLLDEVWRLAWQDYLTHRRPHLLGDSFDPDPWLELIAAAESPGAEPAQDELQALTDGLRAMCLHNELVEGTFRTSTRPPRGPIRIELDARPVVKMSAPGGPHDPVPLAYAVPPAIVRRWRAAGLTAHAVELAAIEAIPDAARLLWGAGT
jgi:hypothetical protein